MLNGKTILITGGTGSFGKQCCREILQRFDPEKVIVFSRDELKQSEMAADLTFASGKFRFFLGDVRDKPRLERAMHDVDYVIHAAALKQVPAAEYNPHEFIKTNINGAMNVVDAAIATGVRRVIALSTDKAVNPINLYGATKLCSDKIFIAANSYSGKIDTAFQLFAMATLLEAAVPLFLFSSGRKSQELTITKPEMTRFIISIKDGVSFALRSLEDMMGGEIFVPKLKSCRIGDLAKAIAPDCDIKVIGLRPGEKLHEALIPADEAHHATEQDDRYIIHPSSPYWKYDSSRYEGQKCPEGFGYNSLDNPDQLGIEKLKALVDAFRNSHLD